MAGAPFQVLVYPYRGAAGGDYEYALFSACGRKLVGRGSSVEEGTRRHRRGWRAGRGARTPDEACHLPGYDGERTALWELHQRLRGQRPRG